MNPLAYKQFLELDRTHWWMRGRRKVYLGLLEHLLRAKRPKRVLDLGAGIGGFLEGLDEIKAEGGRVFPADIDAESLGHIAGRGFPGGIVADGSALPYKDGSFDLICLFDAIEHTPDDLAVMHDDRTDRHLALGPCRLGFGQGEAHPLVQLVCGFELGGGHAMTIGGR